MKTWQKLVPFRQSMTAKPALGDCVVPFIVSVAIHIFLVYLLWSMVSGRTIVEPSDPEIDTPLILSLSTFTNASNDGMVIEVVPEATGTDQPAQEYQTSQERSLSKGRGSESPKEKSAATKETLSSNMEAFYSMSLDFGVMQRFEAESAAISKGGIISGSRSSGGKSFAACLKPLSGLDNFYCMEREFVRVADSEMANIRKKSRMVQIKNYLSKNWYQSDCRDAFSGQGLLAIPYLIRDAVTGNGCKWRPVMKMDEQLGYIINESTDTFQTLLPVNVNNNEIILNITREGEIWIKGTKVDLNAIQEIIEVFRNEYPGGSVVIACEKDHLYDTATEVLDQVQAANIKMVLMVNLESGP